MVSLRLYPWGIVGLFASSPFYLVAVGRLESRLVSLRQAVVFRAILGYWGWIREGHYDWVPPHTMAMAAFLGTPDSWFSGVESGAGSQVICVPLAVLGRICGNTLVRA